MRILQFAFGSATGARFLPHNFERHTVVYTGTHDNDCTRGWYAGMTDGARTFSIAMRRARATTQHGTWSGLPGPLWPIGNRAAAAHPRLGKRSAHELPWPARWKLGLRFQAHTLTNQRLERLAEWTEIYVRC